VIASKSLTDLLAASPPRQKAIPTGHMRERVAAALRGSQPSFFIREPTDAYTLLLYEPPQTRERYEKWADEFLRCCDVLDLEVTDTRDA
jgi:hypothetical protein